MGSTHAKAPVPEGRSRPEPAPRPAPATHPAPGPLWAGLSTFRRGGAAPLRLHAAPAGVLRRSPFDNESEADRNRREALLRSIGNARERIMEMLRTGGLLENLEVPVERAGVRGVVYGAANVGTPDEEFASYTDRHARLLRIVRALQAMGTLYRTAPIPTSFAAPVQDVSGEWTSSGSYREPGGHVINSTYSGGTAEWADLQGAYERYRVGRGQTGPEFDSDWYYLNPRNRIVPYSARGAPRVGRGIQTGAYMVFPDVDGDPLNYFRLDGFTPIPRGSVIIEFWHDDFGYYYWNRGMRVDVPSPWR